MHTERALYTCKCTDSVHCKFAVHRWGPWQCSLHMYCAAVTAVTVYTVSGLASLVHWQCTLYVYCVTLSALTSYNAPAQCPSPCSDSERCFYTSPATRTAMCNAFASCTRQCTYSVLCRFSVTYTTRVCKCGELCTERWLRAKLIRFIFDSF